MEVIQVRRSPNLVKCNNNYSPPQLLSLVFIRQLNTALEENETIQDLHLKTTSQEK
jgi:hypothetical protein